MALAVMQVVGSGPVRAADTVERRAMAMGTVLTVRLTAPDRVTAVAASETVVRAIATAEARLTTWRDDSELARVNRTPVGEWADLSDELATDLAAALSCAERTGGAFDPVVGELVRLWGIRTGGALPAPAAIAASRAGVGFARVELEGHRLRRLHPKAVIDEGGFGKGVGLRDAARAGLAAGATCLTVDLGGQWLVTGDCPQTEVAVADPERRDRAIGHVRLQHGSVATSGPSERSVAAGGRTWSHLVDARSGRPVPWRAQATVWSSDPVVADCLATALAVMGLEDGRAWLTEHPGIAAVLAERRPGSGLDVVVSPAMRPRLRDEAVGPVGSQAAEREKADGRPSDRKPGSRTGDVPGPLN